MAGGRSGIGRDGVRAIVVAAGRGQRLDPYTRRCPKPLLYVAGRPILGHLLDMLRATGIADLVVVVGYLREQIVAYLRTRPGPPPRIVVQEELLGNGHAVHAARAYLDKPVLVLFGDTIPIADLSAPLRAGPGARAAAIGVTEVEDGRAYGIVDVGEDGRVRRIWEKPAIPPSRCAVAGVFFFPDARPLRDALEALVAATGDAPPVPGPACLPPRAGGDPGPLRDPRSRPAGPPGGEFWFVDAIQRMIDRGHPVETFPVERFYDCGTAEQVLTANRELLAQAAIPPGDHGGPDPSADAGTRGAAAFSNTVIEVPCAVSPEATVVDAHIGPFVTVAPGASIIRARVRDAVVLPGAVIEGETIEHAIIDASRGEGYPRGR